MTETPPGPLVAMGVDGARGGWAAACLYARSLHDDDEALGWQTRLHLFPTIDALTTFRAGEGQKAPVTIDVPIGLLDSVDYRSCDRQARELLGKARRDSVFAPPARYMLAAADYPGIRRLVERERERNPKAKGLSAQSAGIVPKVKEVDDRVRTHPEPGLAVRVPSGALLSGARRGSGAAAQGVGGRCGDATPTHPHGLPRCRGATRRRIVAGEAGRALRTYSTPTPRSAPRCGARAGSRTCSATASATARAWSCGW